MGIKSVSYEDGFKLALRWGAGIRGTIIYAVPVGGALLDEGLLMEAERSGTLGRLNAISYGSGTPAVSFTPAQQELRAQWVDLCCCDFDGSYRVVRHERVQTCFNGMCLVYWDMQTIPISPVRQAVQITVHNRSTFPIEANGIGYAVNGRVHPIPLPLARMERRVLPQIDVDRGDTVKLCQVENGYPATFRRMEK